MSEGTGYKKHIVAIYTTCATIFLIALLVLWAKTWGFTIVNENLEKFYDVAGIETGFYVRGLKGEKYK